MALAAFAVVWLAYQFWLLPVLTDWVSSAVDEGFVSYAAQRIRDGAWPHRDFFYLWTPGTPLLHALLQALGADWRAERACALLASAGTSLLVMRWARDWALPSFERALLAALLAVWSFSLWNIPYSSWYAVFFALLAMRLTGRTLAGAGLVFALAFWFKQNVGLLALCGEAAWRLTRGDRRAAARLVAYGALGIAVPFGALAALGGGFALSQALYQIFLFPLRYPFLMGQGLSLSLIHI